MSNNYTLPGMPDWSFASPILSHKGGAGFSVTPVTSVQEIADAIKRIWRGTTRTPDEAAFEVTAQAVRNINWQVMLDPYAPRVAPLLTAAPAAQKVDNTDAINLICSHMEFAYWAIKKL